MPQLDNNGARKQRKEKEPWQSQGWRRNDGKVKDVGGTISLGRRRNHKSRREEELLGKDEEGIISQGLNRSHKKRI